MSDYVKLVLVRFKDGGKGYIFEAPFGAEIKPGDTLACKLRNGETHFGLAVAEIEVNKCSHAYRFIMIANGAVEPLQKIIGKFKYISY